MATVRTQVELDNPAKYNYYLAFKIDPSEKNPEKIEEAIKKQKASWAQGNVEQRKYVALYQDILNVMVNDVSYDAKSDSYSVTGARKRELEAAKKYKIDTAVKSLATASGGIVYKSTLADAKKRERYNWYSVDELQAALKPLLSQNVKFIDDSQNVIDFSTYMDVAEKLKTVGKNTIYEFLNNSPANSKAADLVAAADDVYKNIKSRTTAEGTAAADLVGKAKKIFASDASKKEYDNYLIVKESVWDDMDIIRLGGGTEADISVYEKWANILASNLGMDKDTVDTYLAAGLKRFHIKITGGQGKVKLVECPHSGCGMLYYYDEKAPAKVCPHCGRSLEKTCWNCNSAIPITKGSSVCPACGCSEANEAVFKKALAAMKTAESSTTSTLADLETALRALKGCVPNYNKKDGTVSREVSYFEKVVKNLRDQETKSGNAYREAISKINSEKLLKNYMTALAMAEDLKRKFPSYKMQETLDTIKALNVEIDKAKKLSVMAQQEKARNNKQKALEYASQALDICQDFVEARDVIKQIPPDAPTNVRVSVFAGTATVEWNLPADLHQTTYTIIKKINSAPTGYSDGTELKKNLTVNISEDEDIIPATAYYYAVYAERLGVKSALVQASGSVLVYSDVSGVKQDLVEGKISATWKTPDNIKRIEVWKNDGPIAPSKYGEGTQLTTVTKNSFSDTAGTHCSYRIFCIYDMNGKEVCSKGITRTYKRYEMLKPITDANISARSDGGFNITCTLPAAGELGILYSENRLSTAVDTLFSRSVFASECKGCQQATVSKDINGNMTFSIPANKVVWAYPIVSNEQLFILSAPTLINTIAGVDNVEFTKTAGSVVIKGVANKNATNVIFKVSEKAFAQNINDDGDQVVVDASTFTASGATIHLREDSNSYISILVEFKKNGQVTYTNAVPISNAPIANLRGKRVLFAVEGKASATKAFKIKIKFSASEPVLLPELCVEKGWPRPRVKGMGDLVCKLDPIELKKGFLSKDFKGEVTVSVPPCAPNNQFAVFINDDNCTHIQLNGTNKL